MNLVPSHSQVLPFSEVSWLETEGWIHRSREELLWCFLKVKKVEEFLQNLEDHLDNSLTASWWHSVSRDE